MIVNYLYWQFIESPQKLFFVIEKTIVYLYHLFSINFLVKTLFEPWKKDVVRYANPTLQDRIQIILFNLIARLMGFVMRSLTILTGLIVIICVIIFSIILFIGWVLLPIISLYMIYKGIFL